VGQKILVIEDEKAIVDILLFNLEKEGYEVQAAYDGQEGLDMIFSYEPDLILLDVMLPKMDGFEICKSMRDKVDVPIIILTAREEEDNKILGLEIGADDYITKPFSMKELIARVRANLRRAQVISSQGDRASGSVESFGDISIDSERYEVKKNGVAVDLTMREYDLIKFLATQRDKVFARDELLKQVWEYDYLGDVRTVDVAVRRLREKIEDDPSNPQYIMTRRGVGYYFSGPQE